MNAGFRDSRYRYLVPNSITFVSLGCGVAAILSASRGASVVGGLLVLASYVLDLLDGELARRLNASSEFGLQLDSLADMVSLGAAPAVLAFSHLQGGTLPAGVIWPATLLYVLAGAFRLARFNLLPVKEGQTDSVGLTISTAGATLTLAVLSDLGNSAELAPDIAFILLMVVLALLMASRIRHPSVTWVFSYPWINLLYLLFLVVTLLVLRLSFFNVWFLFNIGFLVAALVRAGYQILGERQ